MSIRPNVSPKLVTMQPKPFASVALPTFITQCQKVAIVWTLLSNFQQHPVPAISTGLDTIATKLELYANALTTSQSAHGNRLIVSAMMNVNPDVTISESE